MTLECGCPEHFPDWDNQDVELGGQTVVALPTPTFLHMPMGYEIYLGRVRHLIQQLELKELWPGFSMSRTGWLKGEIIVPIEESTSPSRHVKRLPSPLHFRAKLHQGGIGTIRNAVRELQAELLDAGRMPKELYLSYLTCPLCAESRGGDKILVVRGWQESARLKQRIDKRSQ